MRYFEDFAVGQIDSFGRCEVTRGAVIAFARAFDPQPFHLDDDAAAANPVFGRLSASGWHTAALTMRMVVDHARASGEALGMGSPGLDELRWLKPVYPGDVLRVETEVIATTAPRSRADIGFVKTRTSVFNQHDEEVMRQVASTIQPRRGG